MGFPRQGPEAHATGAEAPAEALDGLHLIQRQWSGSEFELQQVPQSGDRPVLQQGFVGGEVVVTGAGFDSRMQGLGHLRAVEMELATGAVLHKSHELEFAAVQLGEGLGMQGEGLVGELNQGHASHTAGGSGEGDVDDIRTQTDRFEDLGTVIAGEQRDTDLRKNLAQSVLQ